MPAQNRATLNSAGLNRNVLNRIALRSLRAVEAVARLGTLARAGAELGISAGAVSQLVAAAEEVLGRPLFRRHARGMAPLPEAEGLLAELRLGFDHLAQAMLLGQAAGRQAVTVSVAPTFAARWLVWRLPDFQAAHPGIQVHLDAAVGLVTPGRGEVDFCIRVGRGDWPGLGLEPLFPQVIFPVCSPDLAARLRGVSGLLSVPVIREPSPNFTWDDWLSPGEPLAADLPPGPVFSDAAMCIDAAISGAGVFLTYETLAVAPLADGRLVEPFGRRRATANRYWLVTPPTGRLSRPAAVFLKWLRGAIAREGFGAERPGIPAAG